MSPQQLQQLATLSAQMQEALRELKIQFERIAQMQAQLDSLTKR